MSNILITGAGGTVGKKITKFLLSKRHKVLAVDRCEGAISELIDIKRENSKSNYLKIEFGDILNLGFLDKIAVANKIDSIIHCAALKHLPVGYYFPEKLAHENVLAFVNIVKLVRSNKKIKKVVLCSSDKAANPTSVMGASKKFLETICENTNIAHSKFVSVRFGNILNSSGSITEKIKEKVNENLDILIRDEEMTRYLMNSEDVIDLIMFALKKGKNGDICVIKTLSAKVLDIINLIILKNRSGIKVILGKNDMKENIHESLFNKNEVKNVRKKGKFYIYNRKDQGNLTMVEERRLVSSNNSVVSKNELKKIL